MAGFLDLIPGLTPLIEKALSFIPDPQMKARAQSELLSAFVSSDLAQLEVNKAEAQSGSIFVAGWRPAIGWVCALTLAYHYLGRPVATMIFDGMGWRLPYMPGLDENLWQLMLAMLGMGGLRTFEKMKGVTK